MGLTFDTSKCKKCGEDAVNLYDSKELREENTCMNEKCGYFEIVFEKNYLIAGIPKPVNFDPHSVDKDYSKFLNSLESNEDPEKKYYWGFNSPKEVRELREEQKDDLDEVD